MTRLEFRELVERICKPFGRNYASGTAEVNSIINERLQKFSELTRCIYDPQVTLTLEAHTGSYRLDDPAVFSRPVVQPDIVVLDGTVLTEVHAQDYGTLGYYPLADEGQPGSWFVRPGDYLVLLPTPDDAYTPCYVGGYVLHTALATSSTDDDEDIEIPATAQRAAAVYTAVALMYPFATGPEDLQQVASLDASAAKEIERMAARARNLKRKLPIRGESKSVGWTQIV